MQLHNMYCFPKRRIYVPQIVGMGVFTLVVLTVGIVPLFHFRLGLLACLAAWPFQFNFSDPSLLSASPVFV